LVREEQSESHHSVPKEVLAYIDHFDDVPGLLQLLVADGCAALETVTGIDVVESASGVDGQDADIGREVEDVGRHTDDRFPQNAELPEEEGVEEGGEESGGQCQKDDNSEHGGH
jgi:hypothetical protein